MTMHYHSIIFIYLKNKFHSVSLQSYLLNFNQIDLAYKIFMILLHFDLINSSFFDIACHSIPLLLINFN